MIIISSGGGVVVVVVVVFILILSSSLHHCRSPHLFFLFLIVIITPRHPPPATTTRKFNFTQRMAKWGTGEAGGGKGRCVGSLWVTLGSLEKVYTDPHLNGYAHPICLYSCHSILCYKLLEAHFTVSGNKMTITNKILTNQRRPYK